MWRRWLPILSLCAGCDYLFPMSQSTVDGGAGDGGTPTLSGTVCVLADLRDYRTCQAASGAPAGAFRVSVEETRDTVLSDAGGTFTLPLSKTGLTTITLSASNPGGTYATTIVPLGGVGAGIALPVVEATRFNNAELGVGAPGDVTRGALLAWAIAVAGTPVSNVVASASAVGVGPVYDGDLPDQLAANRATGARGTVALLDLAPTSTLIVRLTPPSGSTLAANQYTLPIRANAITMTTLVLLAQ